MEVKGEKLEIGYDGRIVVREMDITDGENHEGGAVEAAKAAAEKGIQVSVLGVGMPDGARGFGIGLWFCRE